VAVTSHRILVYANREEELDALTSRLDADGHSATGTVVDELAIDLASSSDFEALLVDQHVPPRDQLWITGEIARRNPGILIIRANGPEAVVTQLRQAFTERRAEEEKTRGDAERRIADQAEALIADVLGAEDLEEEF
jgi:DNA-binding NtrC family response regulator